MIVCKGRTFSPELHPLWSKKESRGAVAIEDGLFTGESAGREKSEVFGFFCAVAGPAVGLAFPLLFSGKLGLRV